MKCTISHVDTCLSCYVNRHTDIAIPVDCHTTYSDVIAGIKAAEFDPEDATWTDEKIVAFLAAWERLRLENLDRMGLHWDAELPEDDGSGESVYAYFSVGFSDD